VTTEAERVDLAVSALERNQPELFGRLMRMSHESLRDRLRVSVPALDQLVETAMDAGALGARLTGAGFGGCIVALAHRADAEKVQAHLARRTRGLVFEAIPGDGALRLEPPCPNPTTNPTLDRRAGDRLLSPARRAQARPQAGAAGDKNRSPAPRTEKP
jgi:galactokinase